MEKKDDPSPNIYIKKISLLKAILLLFAFITGISILVNLEDPKDVRASVRTLRTNDLVQVEAEANVLGFIKEDLDQTEFEKVQILQNQKRQLWVQTSPKAYESIIIEQCAAVGCDASQVIRIMYCESSGNPYAANNIYFGLFQHHVNYWPIRASRYGIPESSIYDPYAQVHVTARMFAEGLSYLWECK